MLRKQNKALERDIRRAKEENAFLAEVSAFLPRAVGSQQRTANEVSCKKDGCTKRCY